MTSHPEAKRGLPRVLSKCASSSAALAPGSSSLRCSSASNRAMKQTQTWAAERVVKVGIEQHCLGAGRQSLGRDGHDHVADVGVRVGDVLVD